MNLDTFFAAIRKDRRLGITSLTQTQVECAKLILSHGAGLSRDALAYVLGTAWGEAKLTPVRESLNYSVDGLLKTFSRARISAAEAQRLGRSASRPANQQALANLLYGGAWGEKNLGNTGPNDGWDFRGGGLDQLTGRANYRKRGLEKSPGLILNPSTAAKSLITGLTNGDYRGHKLSDFFGNGRSDFVGARAIVNADVAANGQKYSVYALAFRDALEAAGYRQGQEPVTAPSVSPSTVPSAGIMAAITAFLNLIFGNRK